MNEGLRLILSLSISGSLMAVLLYGLKLLLKNRLPSAFWYYAWLLVLLRFILPLPGMLALPQGESASPARPAIAASSGYSGAVLPQTWDGGAEAVTFIDNDQPTEEAAAAPEAVVSAQPAAAEPEPSQAAAAKISLGSLRPAINSGELFIWLWALGAAASVGWYIIGYARFSAALDKTLIPATGQDRAIFDRLEGSGRLEIYRSGAVSTPMLLGLRRPRLVLPDIRYSEAMLYDILAHELTHYHRKDLPYKCLAVLVYSLHWFNPVMRLIRRELDMDCELSCDERLLGMMDDRDKLSYGETLLSLASSHPLPRPVTATSFVTEKDKLKERLDHIMRFKKDRKTALPLLLSVLLLLCGCSAAMGPSASAPEKTAPPKQVAQDGSVMVSTVDEFLAAIAPDATIVFAPGEYELSSAESFGAEDTNSLYYSWQTLSEGQSQLHLSGVSGMTLKAEEAGTVTLSNSGGRVSVLLAEGCPDLTISNIDIRHAKEEDNRGQQSLDFYSCDKLLIENCSVYNGGSAGIYISGSQSPSVLNSRIYDCSGAAFAASGCWETLVDGCEIYGCGSDAMDWPLISLQACSDSAIINSNIHENKNTWFLSSESSQSLYLGGLKVEENKFQTMFSLRAGDVIVDGCSFKLNDMYGWYNAGTTGLAVSPEGEYLSGEALADMSYKPDVEWTPKSQSEMPAVELKTAADGAIHVSTVDGLISAIAPNTTIYLEKGVYDLSTASNYGAGDSGSPYYSWEASYDGAELQIIGVDGLTLTAADPADVTIATAPRYADVMAFISCKGLSISNITFGHNIEPGTCIGGVLYFSGCGDTAVDNCRLYGCGIVGVTANGCEALHVKDTEIYDCSYGAVDIKNSRDVLFDNCDVYDCEVLMDGLLSFVGCEECAYINSEIYNNMGRTGVVFSSYTQGLYLASLDIHDNELARMIYSDPASPVVSGCAFTGNSINGEWYGATYEPAASAKAVDETGRELSEGDLKAMSLGGSAAWAAEPKAETPAADKPETAKDGAVHVSTVDELLAAIAPDTTIYLEDGVYDLSTAAGYGSSFSEYYSWGQQFDGPELIISGVSGLAIMGGGADKATIAAMPRYADVLSFDNCSDITLSGFTAGHTEEPGSCAGGVLLFSSTDDVSIVECSLYGCGIRGITGSDCQNMLVSKTEIYECSSGGVYFDQCSKVAMVDCDLHDNGGPDYSCYMCTEMTVNGKPMLTVQP